MFPWRGATDAQIHGVWMHGCTVRGHFVPEWRTERADSGYAVRSGDSIQHKGTTQECKKCAKVEGTLYLYGVKMYIGGGRCENTGEKWRMVSANFMMYGVV
jgi:hypothetical protein